MQNVLFYGGIAINVIGDLYLMAYAIKYMYAFYKTRKRPVETDAMKPGWAKKRTIGFGLMILGIVITLVSSLI